MLPNHKETKLNRKILENKSKQVVWDKVQDCKGGSGFQFTKYDFLQE